MADLNMADGLARLLRLAPGITLDNRAIKLLSEGKMNQVMSSQYGDLMNNSTEVNADAMVASMGVNPTEVDDSVKNIFTKDYRKLMKAVDKKKVNNG